MINSLTGQIIDIKNNILTLNVNNIGFAVYVPNEILYSINQEVSLIIYFHWHQENGPQLFGFNTKEEKDAFQLSISCSGIGPKMGLSILSSMNPEQFFTAITLADIKSLSSISGIGAKKAESMVLYLKDKVPKSLYSQSGSNNKTLIKVKDLTEALSSLNYSRPEINQCLEYIKGNFSIETAPFDELLRKGLSFLSKRV